MGRAKKGTLVEHGVRALPSRVDPPEAKPAQVGALLATDAELANLMADGVMAWLVDETYERPHKAERSGQTEVHKKKVHAAMSLRLACRELRAAMDERIGDWMRTYKKLLRSLHWNNAQTRLPPPHGCYVNEQELKDPMHPMHAQRDELLQKLKEAYLADFDCRVCLRAHCGGDLHRQQNEWYLAGVTAGITKEWEAGKPINADLLGEDPCTFFALTADQCQIQNGATYGLSPAGFSKQPRNVSTGNIQDPSFSKVRGTDGKEHVVHSREKNVDAVCCSPRSGFQTVTSGQAGVNQIMAQAMLHKAGVLPPYGDRAVSRATRCWGRHDEWRPFSDEAYAGNVVSYDHGRTRHLPQCFWPERLLLARHPSLPAKTTSLQGVLGLSDADMAACKRETDRKLAQKAARDDLLRERLVQEMLEDVSATVAADERLPFDSIEELQEASPGIVATLRQECFRNTTERVQHALWIEAVPYTLDVLRSFFNEVLEADTDAHGGASSGEAYAFVSGLHYGQYGPRTAHGTWCNNVYGGAAGYARHFLAHAESTSGEKALYNPIAPICAALVFFDELNCELRARTSKAATMPRQWQISATVRSGRRETIDFGCKWLTHEQCVHFRACAASLCAAAAPDCEPLPELFTEHELELFRCSKLLYMKPKLGYKTGRIVEGSKAERAVLDATEKVVCWYVDTFRVLATDPATRCAALDLVGMRSEQLVLERAIPGRYDMTGEDVEEPSSPPAGDSN